MMAHLSSFVSLDQRPHAHLQPLFFRFHPPLFFCLVHPLNNSLCARFPTIEYALAEAEISRFFVFPTFASGFRLLFFLPYFTVPPYFTSLLLRSIDPGSVSPFRVYIFAFLPRFHPQRSEHNPAKWMRCKT
jgi:hypothetical protein